MTSSRRKESDKVVGLGAKSPRIVTVDQDSSPKRDAGCGVSMHSSIERLHEEQKDVMELSQRRRSSTFKPKQESSRNYAETQILTQKSSHKREPRLH